MAMRITVVVSTTVMLVSVVIVTTLMMNSQITTVMFACISTHSTYHQFGGYIAP